MNNKRFYDISDNLAIEILKRDSSLDEFENPHDIVLAVLRTLNIIQREDKAKAEGGVALGVDLSMRIVKICEASKAVIEDVASDLHKSLYVVPTSYQVGCVFSVLNRLQPIDDPRLNPDAAVKTYKSIESAPTRTQKRDCSIIALAIACKVSYKKAAEALRKAGKPDNVGAPTFQILEGIQNLGYQYKRISMRHYIDQYPKCERFLKSVTPTHVERFPEAFADERDHNQVWITTNHVMAFTGSVEDWSKKRALRAIWIYDVFLPGEQPKPDEAYIENNAWDHDHKIEPAKPREPLTFTCELALDDFVCDWNNRVSQQYAITEDDAEQMLREHWVDRNVGTNNQQLIIVIPEHMWAKQGTFYLDKEGRMSFYCRTGEWTKWAPMRWTP